ncbi:MAG: HAMP domain-containing histidine kinase [Ruminiclostridium sp.]|nr:HAMP domain-containing histidine kinase [Ruminiclostridium sp.]
MKKYIGITAAAAVMILAGIMMFVLLTSGDGLFSDIGSREKVIMLNDIARTAEAHRPELNVPEIACFDADFVILDMTDNVLYEHSSKDISAERLSVEAAIMKRYPYRYLTDGGRIWGSVILLDDGTNGYEALRGRFIAGVCICGAVILVGMIVFGVYIKRNIITPFRKMREFAGSVAAGRLDRPLEMDRENIFGAFSESFDIMREELSESKRRELELQKKERELVASLSHDLKTPVTGIKLTAELLQMRLSVKSETSGNEIVFVKDDIEKMSGDAEGILKKAEQIDVLVSDLFASTLDDLGEFKVSCRDEESGVLAETVKNCDDRHLTVLGELPAVIVSIDRKRMAQVVGNIISNSYKYADTAIDVGFELSEKYLEMRIQDHGPGVPRSELDLITNKFYRGKAWTDSGTDGNGLGLYIAKTLMKKMNGDLIAESDGDGLAITLVIPLS